MIARVVALLILCICVSEMRSQSRSGVLWAESKLVLVPVTVTDRMGASVTGLKKENFTVFEDKIPQRIVSFGTQDAPCSVGIVLDASGSMLQTMGRAKIIVERFLTGADPQDEFSL